MNALNPEERKELADFVMKRMDWRAEDFDGYRVRIDYPPAPISVMMYNKLPSAEGGAEN